MPFSPVLVSGTVSLGLVLSRAGLFLILLQIEVDTHAFILTNKTKHFFGSFRPLTFYPSFRAFQLAIRVRLS